MNILAISDKIVDVIYSANCKIKFDQIDLIISCGDLPYYYVEYVLTVLDKPLLYVRGNHASKVEYSKTGERTNPRGAIDIHKRLIHFNDILIAGIEGSVRYNNGDYQYSQSEMWGLVYRLVPRLLYNRIAHGRFLDIFVTHAPPRGIHDKPDPAHTGANAFTWLINTFKPRYHFHGHIHRYHYSDPPETQVGDTLVINAYGYREIKYQK